MQVFTETLSADGAVTLTAYLQVDSPDIPNYHTRPAVLIFPGGAYRVLCEREGEPIALSFLAQGYHAFVLHYSIGEGKRFEDPLRDGETALRLIRSHAEEWRVIPDQIAVCGFSAGGHLAAAMGTVAQERANALVLCYPCILESMSALFPFTAPSLDKAVDKDTPPTFLFHTRDDDAVPVENPQRFAAALDRAGVPFELHIFASGRHGLALANRQTSCGCDGLMSRSVSHWFPLCCDWLEQVFHL
ncbi:MAG: alpha/beta hydrolase [Clostridiales bacterium]|jgi:acetyl esterase/lipase|nr:alpha/beta hydrolase [Clostridiales bacterium]